MFETLQENLAWMAWTWQVGFFFVAIAVWAVTVALQADTIDGGIDPTLAEYR